MYSPARRADPDNWGVNRDHQALDTGKDKGYGRSSGEKDLSGDPY